VQWADFDRDGESGFLPLPNNNRRERTALWQLLPAEQGGDRSSHALCEQDAHEAGRGVRVYARPAARSSHRAHRQRRRVTARERDPCALRLPSADQVDVEVTTMTRSGRKVTLIAGVRRPSSGSSAPGEGARWCGESAGAAARASVAPAPDVGSARRGLQNRFCMSGSTRWWKV